MKKYLCVCLMALSLLAGCGKAIKDEPTPQAQAPAVTEEHQAEEGAQNNSGEEIPLDDMGERLIPADADRVAVTSGNLTLRVHDDLDAIISYYQGVIGELRADGQEVELPSREESGASPLLWRWTGVYDGKPLDVSIYPDGENTTTDYTIIILYGTDESR